jgi:hypothetical protein
MSETNKYPDEHFPLAPDSVRDTWGSVWAHAHYFPDNPARPEMRQLYLTRVNTILDDFLNGKKLSRDAYTAALLVDLADGVINEPYNPTSARALHDFFTRETDEHAKEFAAGILSDRATLIDFWRDKMRELYGESDAEEYLSRADLAELPPQIWETKPQFIRPKEMNEELMRKVNVETILIAGARTLQNLLDARESGDNSSRTLQNVFQAETLLAPLAEIMGVDGLAAALNSAAIRARFEHSGRADVLARCAEIFASYGSHEVVEEKVDNMLARLTDNYDRESNVFYNRAHHVMIGSGLAEIDGRSTRFVWRRKGLGQLAKKIDEDGGVNGREPMDFIGATIIMPHGADDGAIFANALRRATRDPQFRLAPSPSRMQAIHVRGDEAYRERVLRQLATSGFDIAEVEEKPDERGMNLSKFTTFYQDLPVEIQFVDEHVREIMRYGQVSHFGYKLDAELTDDDLESMAQIHNRRDNIPSQDLFEPLAGNAARYRAQIARKAIVQFME